MLTTDINHACKLIKENWNDIKNSFFSKSPGKYLVLTAVYRSPKEQMELFKKGRTRDNNGNWVPKDKSQIVTNVDGYKILGAHNYLPSRAIDVAVVDNQTGQTLWEESNYYCLLEIAKEFGLISGGSWHSIKDWPHLEVPNYKNYEEV